MMKEMDEFLSQPSLVHSEWEFRIWLTRRSTPPGSDDATTIQGVGKERACIVSEGDEIVFGLKVRYIRGF